MFTINETVLCQWGYYKGKLFTIEAILKNGYSCKLKDDINSNYFFYNNRHLIKI